VHAPGFCSHSVFVLMGSGSHLHIHTYTSAQMCTRRACVHICETSPYVASTVPGFTTTSILYLEPVSSLMVRFWPKRVPSTLKKTGPSLGWIRSAMERLMIGGTSSIVPGCCSVSGRGVRRRSRAGGDDDAEEGPETSGGNFHNKSGIPTLFSKSKSL